MPRDSSKAIAAKVLYIYMFTRICTYTCTYIHIHIHFHMHIHIYIYVHRNIYTNILYYSVVTMCLGCVLNGTLVVFSACLQDCSSVSTVWGFGF